MTYKDMNHIKGGMRKAFARSDLYAMVREKYRVEHSDPVNNPRCKKWAYCAVCGIVTPEWKTDVDHIEPMVPVDKHFEDMSLDESANRLWCEIENLQVICNLCHDVKTNAEKELRKPYKKPRNKPSKPRKKRKKDV